MRNRLNAVFAKRSYNRCGCATFFLRSIHTARIASRRRARGKGRAVDSSEVVIIIIILSIFVYQLCYCLL